MISRCVIAHSLTLLVHQQYHQFPKGAWSHWQPSPGWSAAKIHRHGLVLDAIHVADVDLDHHVRQHIAPVEHDRVLEDDANVGLWTIDAFVADRDRPGAV